MIHFTTPSPGFHNCRRRLGQHFLISDAIAHEMVRSAGIKRSDIVFEIGTGLGKVTALAAAEAKHVITCDVDPGVLSDARETLRDCRNVSMIEGDAFEEPLRSARFDVCVTSLPYSRSRDFIDWASERSSSFSRAVAIVQAEFASKLTASPGSANYRAVSVICQISFEIEKLFNVDKSNFRPRPRVNSTAIRFISKNSPLVKEERQMIYSLFSYRRKKLLSALRGELFPTTSKSEAIPQNIASKRINRLTPKEVLSIIQNSRDEHGISSEQT